MRNEDTPAQPLTRDFVPVSNSVCDHSKFSVVSYNILARAYVKNSLYMSRPTYCQWKTRSRAVLSDLKNLNADFYCLQEVDEYDNFYKRNLEAIGYPSVYVQRTGGKPDGCGIFYKKKMAEVLLKEKIYYNDLIESDEDLSPKDVRRLKRDCVGLMTAFKLKKKSTPSCVILANTHIYWDPNFRDVKEAQVNYLVSRLSGFKARVSRQLNYMPPVIVCGDFNSKPEDQVYEYLQSPKTQLQLKSLYGTLRGEPEFTNCKSDFTATLDYIFFSSQGQMKPISYLELPTSDSYDVIGGLPNRYHPSDHLPIGAEFELSS